MTADESPFTFALSLTTSSGEGDDNLTLWTTSFSLECKGLFLVQGTRVPPFSSK